MTYVFIGPPASGKGTQAQLLAQSLKLPYISVGVLLRQLSETNAALAELIENGGLIDEESVRTILKEANRQYGNTLVIDGVPRTPEQVESLVTVWSPQILVVIVIDIPDATIYQRASHRLEAGEKRADDELEVIAKRIQTYRESFPMINEKLRQHGIHIFTINGNQPIEKVQQTIREAIEPISKVI
jgi:adenylate kinase